MGTKPRFGPPPYRAIVFGEWKTKLKEVHREASGRFKLQKSQIAAFYKQLEQEEKAAEKELEKVRKDAENAVKKALLEVEKEAKKAQKAVEKEAERARKALEREREKEVEKARKALEKERERERKAAEKEVENAKKAAEKAAQKEVEKKRKAAEKKAAESSKGKGCEGDGVDGREYEERGDAKDEEGGAELVAKAVMVETTQPVRPKPRPRPVRRAAGIQVVEAGMFEELEKEALGSEGKDGEVVDRRAEDESDGEWRGTVEDTPRARRRAKVAAAMHPVAPIPMHSLVDEVSVTLKSPPRRYPKRKGRK